jgi:hypothetical protein
VRLLAVAGRAKDVAANTTVIDPTLGAADAPPLAPDRGTMLQHLERLFVRCRIEYPDGLCEICRIHPEMEGAVAQLFPIDSEGLSAAAELAASWNAAGYNTYVGVNPRRPRANPGKRASSDDIEIAFFHFVDADDPEAAARLLAAKELPYGFAVTTGRTPSPRGQAYWELEDAVRNLDAWRSVQETLIASFKSDRRIKNPDRIMRLAGSISYPDAKKRTRGYVTEFVALRIDPDAKVVTPWQLAAAFQPATQAAAEVSTNGTLMLSTFAERLGLYEHKVDPVACIERIKAKDHLHDNTLDLITHMIGLRLPDWVIENLCVELLAPVSDGGTMLEVPKMIAWARDRFGIPNPVAQVLPPLPVQDEAAFPGPIRANSLVGTPPPRAWIVPDWLPEGEVTALYGDGGIGKTLLAQQLATAVATGMHFLGLPVQQMPVLAVLCEDATEELHRRQDAINRYLGCGMHPALSDLRLWPRVGTDNFLVMYDQRGSSALTPFYQRLLREIEGTGAGPKLVILDTLADLFGGSEIDRKQVNHFIKAVVRRLAQECEATILLLAHPSLSGMNSGSGSSGSTAWNNAVRQRLYLSRPNGESDDRVLTRKKSNYAKAGPTEKIELYYEDGVLKPSCAGAMGTVESIALQNRRRHVYLEIRRFQELNTPLSLSPKADRYVCKKIRKPECGSASEIADAAQWLLEAGFIVHTTKRPTGLMPVKAFAGAEPHSDPPSN